MSTAIIAGSLLTELYIEVLPKQEIISTEISQFTGKVKQKNGKEKYDQYINQNNGKENVFKHNYQEYILPKDKQRMISMTGQ